MFGSSITVVNDSTLTCEVSDVPGPGAVQFDVIVRINGCIDSLAQAFVTAPTTVVNAEFEEPFAPLNCDPRTPNFDPVTGWYASDELIREGDVFLPAECPHLSCDCPEQLTGCAGGHYASMSTGVGVDQVAWQTIKVSPGANAIFGGWFSWGSDGAGTVNIKLVDGFGPDGTVLATAAVPEGNDWCYSSVSGFTTSDLVTVVWELADTVDGIAAAVHADSMTFEFSICHDPFADADQDGDVDQYDFAQFQLCFTGNGIPYPTGGEFEYCQCFDREGVDGPDGDVDQGDFLFFEQCSSGSNVPADVNCD
jgi:hypothetical protein